MTRIFLLSFTLLVIHFFVADYVFAADETWKFTQEPVTEFGPGTPVVGKRWTLGKVAGDIQFNIHIDAAPNMLMANWYGDIRSAERFYSKIYLVDKAGNRHFLKVKDAAAYGPDAEYGRWKEGPASDGVKVLRFDLTRQTIEMLSDYETLIVNYASFETPDDTHDISVSLKDFSNELAALDQSINSQGGRAFLMTEDEVMNTPINALPAAHDNKWKGIDNVAPLLSMSMSELKKLSINEIKAKVEAQRKAEREAKTAEKRAEHQAIYDQEPDWLDLNVCPKPDVSQCKNIGRKGYTAGDILSGEIDYGKIVGVVWRSEGSIIHIYGGSIDYGIDPEIVRAKSAQYYYVLDKDGTVELKPTSFIKLR